jgi:hypothetical protein
VPGRAAETHFVEFGGPFPGLNISARDYRVVIEVKLAHRRRWKTLADFTLRLGHMVEPDRYIAYSNAPHDLTKEDLANAQARLLRVLEKTRSATPQQTREPD